MTNTLADKLTSLSNTIKRLINIKANKTNGVSEITDADSDDYTNIATMQSGATQASINDGINTVLGNCVKTSLTNGLLKNDGTVDTNTYLTEHQSLSNCIQKSQTSGIVKNDGTLDTTLVSRVTALENELEDLEEDLLA